MAGDAPFASLGDLGINMRLSEDLGMPSADAGIEQATEVMVAELFLGSEGSGTEFDAELSVEKMSGPSIANLLAEARGLWRKKWPREGQGRRGRRPTVIMLRLLSPTRHGMI